eukprot:COSAG02_NODE_47206_length_343_cov_0.364754_1_plen_61_part_10
MSTSGPTTQIATYDSGAFDIFFFNETATTEIYTLSYALSQHDDLPILDASSTSVSNEASIL